MQEHKKHIAILGSTGSIGTQALEVIDQYPDAFEVEVLTANNNADLLIRQAMKYVPNVVVIANETKYAHVKEALSNLPIKVFCGSDSICQVVEMDSVDMVLTAMVGYSGLLPTIRAIKKGKHIALANKETLVVAGDLITRLAATNRVAILPVDSEHSAIFQCLQGEWNNKVEKILLTASGGPFLGKDRKYLEKATKAEALKHPCWEMGAKITIDSASLMNKGLEVIEARWLFQVPAENIEVVVHPQSIIHSMVQFSDGSIKAQMGLPDMKLPIQYAFSYPLRLTNQLPRLDFAQYPSLTFTKPDTENFRNLKLAFHALEKGGNLPCVLNAANEVVVDAFLRDQVGFLQMSDLIEKAMTSMSYIAEPCYEDLKSSNEETIKFTKSLINTHI
ncbi:MAG TPA: 1-deoxy-D-xylulose-5-phosphate reductoisomerase [Bacteroidales bacterium]|nr:1-deoxy-D-xylulose-5-phosphate reductoisomerase [Bacteroidales bacterium]